MPPSPMTDAQLIDSLARRYEALVIRSVDGCWGWSRKVPDNPGYPRLGSGKYGRVAMHRFSYERHIGPIPDDLWVLHRCDNKICTRPDHLYLGDQADNGRDIRERRTSMKDACRRGHPKTPENTYELTDNRGYVTRHCSTCRRERQGYKGLFVPRRMTDTHCGHGHELAVVGLYTKGGRLRCKQCVRESNARR